MEPDGVQQPRGRIEAVEVGQHSTPSPPPAAPPSLHWSIDASEARHRHNL